MTQGVELGLWNGEGEEGNHLWQEWWHVDGRTVGGSALAGSPDA